MSEKIKILSPVVERYSIDVSIHIERPVLIVNGWTIYDAEEYFIRQRDHAETYQRKVELDRARALFKYASACNAFLEEVKNVETDKKLIFSFGFYSLDSMLYFKDTMSQMVDSATMK